MFLRCPVMNFAVAFLGSATSYTSLLLNDLMTKRTSYIECKCYDPLDLKQPTLNLRAYSRNPSESLAGIFLVNSPFSGRRSCKHRSRGVLSMQVDEPKSLQCGYSLKRQLSGRCGAFSSSICRLGSAVRRIGALTVVDASLAAPRLKPICDKILKSLNLKTSSGNQFMHYRKSKYASVLLVLAHPSEQPSLCRSLADIWEESLCKNGVRVERLHLDGASQFGLNNAAELRASLRAGEAAPARIQELQGLVEENQFLVFVHPVFWYEIPSQLKGFLESVMSSGFAFSMLPNHCVLNLAALVLRRLVGFRRFFLRYLAYGLLRDKHVYVTRTHGGTPAGMGIYGHRATSLESCLQFCGARLRAVDRVGFVHSSSSIKDTILPKARRRIESHSRAIAAKIKKSSLPPRPSSNLS